MARISLIILLSMCVVFATSQRKSGDCPPTPDVGVCDWTCAADKHCPGAEKCCRTACGGTFCTTPITARRLDVPRKKPGFCPEVATGPWVCSSRCAYDSDCRSSKKCCKNRCGAMACVRPE